MIYYVDSNSNQNGNGTKESPFKTIQQAADIAVSGDEVIVAPGIYREYVNPKNGGTKENPIIYRSEKPKEAHITGAEPCKNWTKLDGDVYVARIPNSTFGTYNPFNTFVRGDWFVACTASHTADVFLNEKSMYEVPSLENVTKPKTYIPSWDQEFTLHTWYTEQNTEKDETVIYANFQGKNPNEENVEISVRQNCFLPSEMHKDYITFSGFKVSKAATQWAPPTAYQDGMIGPHWSKGWIIEDCEIYESKCSGISLGKYYQKDNDNKWLEKKYKDGTQTQRDCVCIAQLDGWSKETIGSHIVRRCEIYNCGQTGIVGHLGGVFSIIEDNHIHHINNKQNLAGAEIGGIKMHAAIDVIYRRNHIHNCTRGIWLDWQAQGTRVTQNLFHDNCVPKSYNMNSQSMQGAAEDLFIEVSHGPTLVDNNIFLSDRALKIATQGVALIHNIIAGGFTAVGLGTYNGAPNIPSDRYTPYHAPHKTDIIGFMTILHGDNHFYNNIFIQQPMRPFMKKVMNVMKKDVKKRKQLWDDGNIEVGTIPFNDFPTFHEWDKMFEGYCGEGSVKTDKYYSKLPVWANGNLYFNGAKPMKKELDAYVDSKNKITLSLEKTNGKYFLKTNLYDFIPNNDCKIYSTSDIREAFETEQKYENPDGTPITFNTDFFGESRSAAPIAGPFASKDICNKELF